MKTFIENLITQHSALEATLGVVRELRQNLQQLNTEPVKFVLNKDVKPYVVEWAVSQGFTVEDADLDPHMSIGSREYKEAVLIHFPE